MKLLTKFFFTMAAISLMFAMSCKKKDSNNKNNSDPNETGTVTDIDGNVYKTVKIGDNWWMAENLKTTRYNDGTLIPLVKEHNSWEYLQTPGYCWYGNDSVSYKKYGALYNWYTIGTGKLAPKGWHIPTSTEWWTLINYLGGWQVAGGKMKSVGTIEAGTGLWYSPNTGATNESGFSAISSGNREEGGNFQNEFGYVAYWWTATVTSSTGALDCITNYNTSYAAIEEDAFNKSTGLSIRCIKD